MTEAFEEELRQAISGEDFENYGLKEDPFIISKKSHFFNRDDEKKILPRQISRLGKGKTEHIAITGERGIGKTSFLTQIIPAIEKFREQLGYQRIYFILGLAEFESKFIKSTAIIEEIISKPNERTLFIFDDLDIIFNRFPEAIFVLREIESIGTWTIKSFQDTKENKKIKLPNYEELLLKPLNRMVCQSILKSRISSSYKNKKEGKELFDEAVIEELVILSEGNPQRLLSWAQQFFTFMIARKFTSGNISAFTKFRESHKIPSSEQIIKIFESLTEKQKEVINIILNKIEITSNELRAILDIARSTAVEYLSALKGKGLLDIKLKGREAVYYIPTDISYILEGRAES